MGVKNINSWPFNGGRINGGVVPPPLSIQNAITKNVVKLRKKSFRYVNEILLDTLSKKITKKKHPEHV
jgi:hypothetical protein